MQSVVASRYARALADAVGRGATDPRQVLGQLRAVSQMVETSPELRTVLLSPAVPPARKRAVMSRLAPAAGLSGVVLNFLFVAIDRRRANILGEIADAFETVLDERSGVVRAEVQSAAELNERQRAAIQQELSRVAGKQVRCEFAVDPALIGGVVARVGSTVYDGSVRTQLASMRERLAAR